MKTLSCDIETYSPVNLAKSGVYPYAEHEDFDILTDTSKSATTQVMIAAESDETFLDAGHAIEWALGMIHTR